MSNTKLLKRRNGDTMEVRSGLKDAWNAFMCEGATFSASDIPFCPTTGMEVPHDIVTWEEAKSIYKKALGRDDCDFFYDAYVCWYLDDVKFDGPRGIWRDCRHTIKVLRHFAGAITPDFSTNQDFPEPLKVYSTYRMRAFGFWLRQEGIAVINNVRWRTEESYRYCFDGLPENSILAIGTVGGSPRKLKDRYRFKHGLEEMVNRLHPHTIIVYGSANYPCFDTLVKKGVVVISCPGQTAQAFGRGKRHE